MTPGGAREPQQDTREIVLVTSPGCHFCSHARSVLERVSADVPMRVREIALESVDGAEALKRWRVPFPPILTVDGSLFGYGRISERRLRRHLERRGE